MEVEYLDLILLHLCSGQLRNIQRTSYKQKNYWYSSSHIW